MHGARPGRARRWSPRLAPAAHGASSAGRVPAWRARSGRFAVPGLL